MTSTAATGAASDARTTPPTARPTAAKAAAPRPSTTVPSTTSLDLAADHGDGERQKGGDDGRDDREGRQHPEPAPNEPAGPRDGGREDDVESVFALVGGPADDHPRAGQPDDERAEAEEGELEQARRLEEVDARVEDVEVVLDLRRARGSPRLNCLADPAMSAP